VRILLVEDSPRVADTVGEGLRAHGHTVCVAAGVRAAERAFQGQHFDVAVVDIGLPDGCGLEWCRATRSSGCTLPILLLTARNSVGDRVAGLDAGADDYLGKPFSVEELAARVRALGRRGPRWTESVRAFGPVVVDCDRRAITVNGTKLALTARELDIVTLIAWREGRLVPRDEVLDVVWGDPGEWAAASLDVLLVRIRRKFAERGISEAVTTVRQQGYVWALERSKRD
jgi:DNA-binding response OmpR family regulator